MRDVLRRRGQVLSVLLGITAALAAGCGTDHHTIVQSPTFLPPSAVARYPVGTPARAAVQLLLAIEYNDPTAAASYLIPAWKLSHSQLAREIRGPLAAIGRIIGLHPRIISEVLRGPRATLIVAIPPSRAVIDFEKFGSRWELSRASLGSLVLAPSRSTHRRAGSRRVAAR